MYITIYKIELDWTSFKNWIWKKPTWLGGEVVIFEAFHKKTGLISDVLLPAISFEISWALGLRPQNAVSAPSQLYKTILFLSVELLMFWATIKIKFNKWVKVTTGSYHFFPKKVFLKKFPLHNLYTGRFHIFK